MGARWSGGYVAALAGVALLATDAVRAADRTVGLERCVALRPSAPDLTVLPRGSVDCLVVPPAARELRTVGSPQTCVTIDGTTVGRAAGGSPTCVRAVDEGDVQVLRGSTEACLGVNRAAGALSVLSRKDSGCLAVDWTTGTVAATGESGRTRLTMDLLTGRLGTLQPSQRGQRTGTTAIDSASGTPSPVGSVPRPIRVAQPSGEWLLDDRPRWGSTDRFAVRAGVRYGQWDLAGVTSGTLVDGAPGTEREAARADDTIDTLGVDLRLNTPYGDFEVVYEEGDGSAHATEPVGGAQIGFVYHGPSDRGSLGLNTGRTGGDFRIDTDLTFVGGRYAFPWSLYRSEREDCKFDLRAVIAASRLRTRYNAWQGNASLPTIYSETRQEVEEDRYGAGVRGVYGRRLSDGIVGRFVLDLDLYYRKSVLDSEQRNVCGASGCPPGATFTATVRDEDSGFAWSAGLGASLGYEFTRNSRFALSAGYRFYGQSTALVNPVRTIDFDGPPRLADHDVATWSVGMAYVHRF